MERPLISVERLLVIRYQIKEESTFNRHPHLSFKTVLKVIRTLPDFQHQNYNFYCMNCFNSD